MKYSDGFVYIGLQGVSFIVVLSTAAVTGYADKAAVVGERIKGKDPVRLSS